MSCHKDPDDAGLDNFCEGCEFKGECTDDPTQCGMFDFERTGNERYD